MIIMTKKMRKNGDKPAIIGNRSRESDSSMISFLYREKMDIPNTARSMILMPIEAPKYNKKNLIFFRMQPKDILKVLSNIAIYPPMLGFFSTK